MLKFLKIGEDSLLRWLASAFRQGDKDETINRQATYSSIPTRSIPPKPEQAPRDSTNDSTPIP